MTESEISQMELTDTMRIKGESIHFWNEVSAISSDLRRNIIGADHTRGMELDSIALKLSPLAEKLLQDLKGRVNNTGDAPPESEYDLADDNRSKSNDLTADEATKEKDPQERLEDAQEKRDSQQEEEMVRELKQRDTEVKMHEQQHISSAGGHIRSGPSYSYQIGPDGKRYAIGGEVSIDVSPVPDNPEATILKAQTVRRSALAPSSPSAADHAVAADANRMERNARRQIEQRRQQEINGEELVPERSLPRNARVMHSTKKSPQQRVTIERAYRAPQKMHSDREIQITVPSQQTMQTPSDSVEV